MTPRTALPLALLLGATAAALGPRAVAPRDRLASEPFAFVPPPGYLANERGATPADGHAVGTTEVWVRPPALGEPPGTLTPNISVVHAPRPAPRDDGELGALAASMPGAFAANGIAWSLLRDGMHTRPDGARIPFVEGAAHAPGGEPYRVLQMAFPLVDGTAIVTASFAEGGAPASERELDVAMDAARGVSFVAPEPSSRAYVAWGGGTALAALVVLLGLRRSPRAAFAAKAS